MPAVGISKAGGLLLGMRVECVLFVCGGGCIRHIFPRCLCV